jgi:hypothetical protein
MGQSNPRCDCSSDDARTQLEAFIDIPNVTKEDVQQIWKCFEYLKPKNGVVNYASLVKSKDTAPIYMNEIMESLLSIEDDITFEDFFNIMKPKILKLKGQGNDSVLMESNSTNVSCLICPYRSYGSSGVSSLV